MTLRGVCLNFALMISMSQAYALSNKTFTNQYPITGLSYELQKEVQEIVSRNGGAFVRPESCPMSSKNYGDIVNKVKSIRGLFKDPNCLNDNTVLGETYDDLVSTSTGIQEQLTTAGVNQPNIGVQSTPISGTQINSVFNSINTLFFQSSCQLADKNFLEKGADFAQNFAQIGLLIPNVNGIYVTGGSLAMSGILNLINKLFTKKFDFSNNSDRLAFIKLNCAYYDIRRDIEKAGVEDVPLPEYRQDLARLTAILKQVNGTLETNKTSLNKQLEQLDKMKAKFVDENGLNLRAFQASLNKAKVLLDKKVADQDEGKRPAETVKREMLLGLVKMREQLINELVHYMKTKISTFFFDSDFKQELNKLDHVTSKEEFKKLLAMPAETFNNSYRASLLFHVERVLSNIEVSNKKFEQQFEETPIFNGANPKKYRETIQKMYDENNKSLIATRDVLNPITERLNRVVESDNGYTRDDDGTENSIAIHSSLNEITNQVFGKWGLEFLKYSTGTALKNNGTFNDNFEKFAKAHLARKNDNWVIKDKEDLSELRVNYACQDAKHFVKKWKNAENLSNQGYDFIATNKELFHSDHPKPFLSFLTKVKSSFEKIQNHHKSSLFARKVIRNESISLRNREKYLGGEYLGAAMLKVDKSKEKAQLLQRLINNYDCGRVLNSD